MALGIHRDRTSGISTTDPRLAWRPRFRACTRDSPASWLRTRRHTAIAAGKLTGESRCTGAARVPPQQDEGVSLVIVHRSSKDAREYLVLRAFGAVDDGDWVWRPPSGGIEEGESEFDCAVRELFEETGLVGVVTAVPNMSYPTFVVEVPLDAPVELSEEHDALEWVSAEELVRRCRPRVVSDGIATALEAIGHLEPERTLSPLESVATGAASRQPDATARIQIYFQGFLNTGCFLYAQANAYKALTGKRVSQTHWNRAIERLPDPVLFLGGTGATRISYDDAVGLIEVMLEAFSDPGETFTVDKFSPSDGVAEFCREISPTAVVVFAYEGESEFQHPESHVVCGVATTEDPEQTLHLACSAAFSGRYLRWGEYFERHHSHLGRWSNDSLTAASQVVIAPNFRWLITLRQQEQ